MERSFPVNEIARPQSQASYMRPRVHHRQISSATLPDNFQRSRPDVPPSTKIRSRPKSRGSTASVQSAGTATHYQQGPSRPSSLFIPTEHQEQLCQVSPEEMLARYGVEQFAQTQQYKLDTGLSAPQQNDMQQYAVHQANYASGIPHYSASQDQMQHVLARAGSFAATDNQSPAPEDSEAAENGLRKKRGSATSLANDAELRRLLQQNHGKDLREVAAEVQQNEGEGQKSEKAKQVFAMLWLQESCQRSNQSVRRDRVFERYTERCGDERVPVLNAASFGKLVRIIFPNVQTRRLGVRGESKYHYVDLSLVLSERAQPNPHTRLETHTRPRSQPSHNEGSEETHKTTVVQLHGRNSQQALTAPPDTAEFPQPSAPFGPPSAELTKRYNVYPPPTKGTGKIHCEKSNASLLKIPTNNMSPSLVAFLPSVRPTLPATLTTYLGLPSSTSHTSPSLSQTEANIELPEIHSYLVGVLYDPPIADSLSSLYRSYCIMVIDSFRFCREKPFFHHHTAFNGTMTVPVAKLLAEPQLAPWIEECDMRMYKKMIRYIAPLVTQVVPDPVWAVFDRVSTKLVEHLVTAFERKCPTHVIAAKVVPATRFCSLLKKLFRVNQAANNVAPLLSEERTRSQMWADMVTVISPDRLLDESTPSPECWQAVERILRRDMRELLTPLDEEALRPIETAEFSDWVQYFVNTAMSTESDLAHPLSEGSLDRWIQWLEKLPKAFKGHHPQCIIDWHTRFWDSILTQLGMGGAQSYQAWWFLKAFLSSMLGWMTQMEGLLLPEAEQRRADGIETEKRNQDEGRMGNLTSGLSATFNLTSATNLKRKRTEDDIGGEDRSISRFPSISDGGHESRQRTMTSTDGSSCNKGGTAAYKKEKEEREDQEVDEQERSQELNSHPSLDLPSMESSASPSEQPQQRHCHRRHHLQSHDDSGISLDADIEDGPHVPVDVVIGTSGDDDDYHNPRNTADTEADCEREKQKRLRREWGILSDPVDAMGEVVVI